MTRRLNGLAVFLGLYAMVALWFNVTVFAIMMGASMGCLIQGERLRRKHIQAGRDSRSPGVRQRWRPRALARRNGYRLDDGAGDVRINPTGLHPAHRRPTPRTREGRRMTDAELANRAYLVRPLGPGQPVDTRICQVRALVDDARALLTEMADEINLNELEAARFSLNVSIRQISILEASL